MRGKTWRAGAMAAVLACSVVAVAANGASAKSGTESGDHGEGNRFTFAVIGDIPYGDAQIAAFPARIDQLNADPDVQLIDHLGDIKSGSSQCTDAYFASIKTQFDRVKDPLVYTPGDNEWTDCHRPNNGSYNPLERLAAVRSTFFPQPGRTLGQRTVAVDSQAAEGYPENVSYTRGDVAFAAVHIVGSNNSLVPWTGKTSPTPEQTAEVLGRTSAAIQLVRDTFRRANEDQDRAVVLLTQADMFDPTVAAPTYADWYGFEPIVKAIAQEASAFHGPVFLFNGDSHVYNQDHPLAAGSSWLSLYHVATPAPNVARVTVEGSTGVDEWLKVVVDKHDPGVLAITRVPFH
jgi:hypothetical protein